MDHYEYTQLVKYSQSENSLSGGIVKCRAVVDRKRDEIARLQQETYEIEQRENDLRNRLNKLRSVAA